MSLESPYWYGILAVAVLALIVLAVGASKMKALRRWQPYAAGVVVLAVLAGTWFRTHGVGVPAGPAGLHREVQPWQALVAFLPTLIILYHAFNLWRERPLEREAARGDREPQRLEPKLEPQLTEAERERERRRVEAEIDAYYGADAIIARYVLPALLLPIVGLWQFAYVEGESLFNLELSADALWPFEYGLFGAYVFVFLELGKRAVRNDITPVSVLWCLTTLVLGPALAALLPSVFTGQQNANWGERALWVFAGYSPRVVFRALERGVRKTLLEEEQPVREERRIPLERVSGIGVEEAERLAQEGIRDVHGLACVDPIRLMRDTRFDNWQILSWVDQALLISWVNEDVWHALLKHGYQGASDVSALVDPPGPRGRTMSDEDARAILVKIADAAQTTELELRDELTRLVQDLRTRSLRALARHVLSSVEPGEPQAPAPSTSRDPPPFGGAHADV